MAKINIAWILITTDQRDTKTFNTAKVLNTKGKLIKILTSEALSKRHWGLFEEELKPSHGKKNKFNDYKKGRNEKNNYGLNFDDYRLEGH